MGQFLILIVVAPLVVAALIFGVYTLITSADDGLQPAEPDGRANPLPLTRPLIEADLSEVQFDVSVRGYRMAQVDQALRRAAYDTGYKEELINVLEAEVTALREGRLEDADLLRQAREKAARPATTGEPSGAEAEPPEAGAEPEDAGAEPEDAGPEPAEAGADSPESGPVPRPVEPAIEPRPAAVAAEEPDDPVQEWVASGATAPDAKP
ncbi:MAG: DivIVA domain-containing protein [Micromonosporaceae bacterium]|nr:DivIVA domain-containing protein [Micromonosporaceae bacterium]